MTTTNQALGQTESAKLTAQPHLAKLANNSGHKKNAENRASPKYVQPLYWINCSANSRSNSTGALSIISVQPFNSFCTSGTFSRSSAES